MSVDVTVAMIPLKDIDANRERNVRVDYKEIDALAATIQDQGQNTALRVAPEKEAGKYRLISGFRRFAALQKLKSGVARCEIVRGTTPDREDWENVTENVVRNNLTSFEQAKGFCRQQDSHKWSGEDMAKRLGMGDDGKGRLSSSQINNLMRAFRKLVPEALEQWRKGQLTNDGAFTLASRKPEEQKEMLSLVKGRSGKALTEAVDAYDNPAPVDKGSNGAERDQDRASRPTLNAIGKAVAWAKEKGFEEALPALRWAAGEIKKLEIDGHKFSTRAPEKTEKAE